MAIHLRVCLLLIGLLLAPGIARGAYQYFYFLQVSGTVNPRGTCVSGIDLVACHQAYSSDSNPLPGFSVGNRFNSPVSVTYRAVDGPVTAVRQSHAEFAIAPAPLGLSGHSDIALLTYYLQSEGQLNVVDTQAGFGASAHAFGIQLLVDIRDNILVEIPSAFDGQAVPVSFAMPVTAFGFGSSWGRFSTRVGDDTLNREFGHQNFLGTFWDIDEVLNFGFVREANDPTRTFIVPFRFEGDFRSATLNDAAYNNALNSIGLEAHSLAGVTFSSESGFLDYLLAPAVPEPNTYVLLCLGLLLLLYFQIRIASRARMAPFLFALVGFFLIPSSSVQAQTGSSIRLVDNADRCVQVKFERRPNLSPGYEWGFVQNVCSFAVQAIACYVVVDPAGALNQGFPDRCTGNIGMLGSVVNGKATAWVLQPGAKMDHNAGKAPQRIREGFLVACPVRDPSDSSRWIHMRKFNRNATGEMAVVCSSETTQPSTRDGVLVDVSPS